MEGMRRALSFEQQIPELGPEGCVRAILVRLPFSGDNESERYRLKEQRQEQRRSGRTRHPRNRVRAHVVNLHSPQQAGDGKILWAVATRPSRSRDAGAVQDKKCEFKETCKVANGNSSTTNSVSSLLPVQTHENLPIVSSTGQYRRLLRSNSCDDTVGVCQG